MVALRSARLEALLNSRLEQVQHSQLMTLVSNQVPESFDLDFKSEMYSSSERDKHNAATDVAALANTAGGLLVLGIEEDEQARAKAAPGIALAEEDERRIRQVVGSRVVPMPVIDVLRIPDPASPGHGLVLIAVPRSPLAPHAVLVNEGLRYPKRNGATTRYLSEPEVADAYRTRFAATHRQEERAREIEATALTRLATTDDQAWVVVSLVPDLPGELIIDQAALRAVRAELMGQHPLIMPVSTQWVRVNIARRRISADGTMNESRQARYLSAELYDDGAGVFGAFVLLPGSSGVVNASSGPEARRISDEALVNGILSGLRFLARHGRDRAGAGGNALVRAQLYPVGGHQPFVLSQSCNGFIDSVGTQIMTGQVKPPERVAPLDGLAAGGSDLVSAAYLLASDLFQDFGVAEAVQLTRDGGVRLPYWGQEWISHAEQWATLAGISTTRETLPG